MIAWPLTSALLFALEQSDSAIRSDVSAVISAIADARPAVELGWTVAIGPAGTFPVQKAAEILLVKAVLAFEREIRLTTGIGIRKVCS